MHNNERKLAESWIANADAWTESIRQQQIESRKIATDQVVIDAIQARNPKRVLDIGCGEGWLSRTVSNLGIEVVGIDGSEKLIAHAQAAGGAQFIHLNYEELIANPEQVGKNYDVVVCNFSLLSEELSPLLRTMSYVLSDRGVIMIHTLHPFNVLNQPYEDGWRVETFEGMGDGYSSSMPWFYRTMGSWLKEIGSAGLSLIDIKEPLNPKTGKPFSLLMTTAKNIRVSEEFE